MQEKFTFNIEAPRFKKKMIFFKEETESREHVVLKLLAYLLFYDEMLRVEVAIGTHYKPDLVIEGDHGVPSLWIDCGRITLKKIESLAGKFRKTKIVIVKSEKNETLSFQKQAERRVGDFENIQYVYFDRGFVARIAEGLNRSNDVVQWQVKGKPFGQAPEDSSANGAENVIGIALGDQVFESSVNLV